jgi:hypothetical protein
MTPIEEIAAERERQKAVEGWTEAHDDAHRHAELALAAAAYAIPHFLRRLIISVDGTELLSRLWPWDWNWWKSRDRRRDLVKAAALLVAEIERLDRAAQQKAA